MKTAVDLSSSRSRHFTMTHIKMTGELRRWEEDTTFLTNESALFLDMNNCVLIDKWKALRRSSMRRWSFGSSPLEHRRVRLSC